MSRTRRPAPVPSEAEPPHGSGPMEGRLVGYRIVRRIASGARADVYLAAAESAAVPEPVGLGANADWAPPPSEGPREADRPTTVLVVLRVYAAGVADDEITNEIEAMSADATGTLPSLIDVANLEDGRCCLVVERLGGRPLSRLLGE
jgi:eukaryotic-like serine/threonine-protein kinase